MADIRMEEPSSERGSKPKYSKRQVVKEIVPMGGFVNFLREHTVVTLAIGFAIATQAQALIKQLVSSFIDPLWGLLFTGTTLSQKTFILHFHGRTQEFAWGQFLYTLIDFMFVLLAIYLLIKIFALDRLERPKVEDDES